MLEPKDSLPIIRNAFEMHLDEMSTTIDQEHCDRTIGKISNLTLTMKALEDALSMFGSGFHSLGFKAVSTMEKKMKHWTIEGFGFRVRPSLGLRARSRV
mgnify:CR=1 FL=1